MKIKKLNSSQIITFNDYPVHSEDVLVGYFNKCKAGNDIPLIPIISINIVKKYFNNTILSIFEKFKDENPSVEYFMLDGNHRTTAMTLAGRNITVAVCEKDEDIVKLKQLITIGQILENGILDHTLQENCEILNDHFKKKPYFMTIEQKTNKMIREGILPKSIALLKKE